MTKRGAQESGAITSNSDDVVISGFDNEPNTKNVARKTPYKQTSPEINHPNRDSEKSVSDDEKFKNGNLILVVLCFVNLFANSAYSSIAPFYPREAVAKGVPTSVIGFVFSSYSLSMCIFAPIFAHLLYTQGAKKVLIMGCVCEGVSMVVFGLFDYIQTPTSYAVASFLCRFLEGFGNGCLNSSCKSFTYS